MSWTDSCARIPALALALVLSFGATVSANAAPLVPERVYSGGTRVDSAPTGISLSIPEGYQAQWDGSVGALLMYSETKSILLGVYGYSEGELEETAEYVLSLIGQQGIELFPIDSKRIDERTMRASFQARTAEGPGRLQGIVRSGDAGNVLVIAALGRSDAEVALDAEIDAVLASVKWSAPEARQWRQLLAGKGLSTKGYDSNYSSGGAGGGGSYASGSQASVDFCSDGSYAYYSRSESYMSIEGMSAESVSEDAHNGMWWLVSDLAGTAAVVLESNEGGRWVWLISESGDGVLLDGVGYGVGASQKCY